MKRGQAAKGETVFGSDVLVLALEGPPQPGPDTGEWREHGQMLWSSVLGGDGIPV